MITAKHFRERLEYESNDHYLEICNCPKVGTLGHLTCGWDE